MYLGVAAAIVALFVLAVPPLVSEAEDLVSNLPQYAADLQAWVTALPERYPFLPPLDLAQSLGGQLQDVAAQAAAVLGQAVVVLRVALGVLGGVLNGLFVLILALYITADHPRLLRYVVGFLPADRQARGERVAERIGDRLGGWLRGQLTLSAIIGAMTLVGLWLIGVRYAVLLAIVAAVGEAIPLIGPIISAVPAVIIAFFHSTQQGLLTIGLYVLVQQLENNLVVPKVMEKAVALHPMVVMVALLAGGELLGVTGAVLSVPVAAGLSVLLDVVRSERQADAAAWGEPVPDQPELLTSPPTKSSDDAPPPDGRKAASGQDPEHARRAA
jgi:predicted PurR-regulated permease PerM